MRGIILASGRSRRFGKPKPLQEINGVIVVEDLIDKMRTVCDGIYVTVNYKDKSKFEYLTEEKNVRLLVDNSYSGTGGTLKNIIDKIGEDDYILSWGDNVITDTKFLEDLLNTKDDLVIPIVREDNPYVSILLDEKEQPHNVLYSKSDYTLKSGWHDFGVFKIGKNICGEFDNILGYENEYRFLDIINIIYLKKYTSTVLKYSKPYVSSFNTVKELYMLEEQRK